MKLSSDTKKKSISFYSYHLNKEKYKIIENFALQIRAYKNFLSELYFNQYFHKKKITCFNFMKEMKTYCDKDFPSSFFQQICKQIYESYNKKKETKKTIEFKKLSFIGINVYKNKMFEESKNKYTNGIINFNIPKIGCIEIPFKYYKKYHGKLEDIKHSICGTKISPRQQKQYVCTLLGNNKLKISIAVDYEEKEIKHTIEHIEGIDVNVKHNLLQCSDGYSLDYDRKLVNKIQKSYKKLDKIQSIKAKRSLSTDLTFKQLQINLKNKRRSNAMIEQTLVKLFKHCQKHNIDHLVFEDLNKFTGKSKFRIKNSA